MNRIFLMTGVTGLLMGGALTARAEDDVERAKDRIEERAEAAKDRVEKNAKAEKARIDRNAEVAKERVEAGARVRADGTDGDGDSAKTEMKDTWITTKVKAKFLADERVKGLDITVDTNRDGVVTLTGTVPTLAMKLRAAAMAKATEGVRGVDNRLTVRGDLDRR